jgi:DNA-binding PadR family transcriptional regulator
MFRQPWRGFDRGQRHFGERGPQHSRPFDHGDLRYIILQLIADKPRHGYAIIKAIEEQLGGMYSPSPGVVYPTLALLEELRYVIRAPVGSRKEYLLTAEGSVFLDNDRAVVDAVVARLAVRLGKGPLTAEQIGAITAALERVASEIERY